MKNKKTIIWTIIIGVVVISVIIFWMKYKDNSDSRPMIVTNEISYKYALPSSATDVNEKVEYLKTPPGKEYKYYLKAHMSEQEFKLFAGSLKLVWGSSIQRVQVPAKNSSLPWWNPPLSMFIYAMGNGTDFIMQADYISETGYMYLYITQN